VSVNRSIVFSYGCDFEFSLNERESVSLAIEKYTDTRQGQRALRSDLTSFTAADDLESPARHHLVKIDTKRSWDEAFFYSSHQPDNLVLLRKGRFKIVLISGNFDTLLAVEQKLRNIRFGK